MSRSSHLPIVTLTVNPLLDIATARGGHADAQAMPPAVAA
jgi:hypothetical protein